MLVGRYSHRDYVSHSIASMTNIKTMTIHRLSLRSPLPPPMWPLQVLGISAASVPLCIDLEFPKQSHLHKCLLSNVIQGLGVYLNEERKRIITHR